MHLGGHDEPVDVYCVVVHNPSDRANNGPTKVGHKPQQRRPTQVLGILMEWRYPVVVDEVSLQRVGSMLDPQQRVGKLTVGGRFHLTDVHPVTMTDPWGAHSGPGPATGGVVGSGEIASHDQAWHLACNGIGGTHDPKSGGGEHRLGADERHGQIHPPGRIDRIGLNRRRSM